MLAYTLPSSDIVSVWPKACFKWFWM